MKKASIKIVALTCILTFIAGGALAYLILSATGLLNTSGTAIEFSMKSVEKTYDGNSTAYSDDNVEISSGSLKEGHSVKITYDEMPKDVGTYSVGCNISIVNTTSNEDVSKLYNITIKKATYTIKPYALSIKLNPVNWEYNGSSLELNGFTYLTNARPLNGDHIVIYNNNNMVYCTDSFDKSLVSVAVLNNAGTDVTNNYDLSSVDYNEENIVVEKRAITIAPKDVVAVYDGESKEFTDYTITSGSLALNETIQVNYSSANNTGNVGEYSGNVIVNDNENTSQTGAAVIKTSSGKDVTSNYEITKEEGTITINKKELTVTIDPITLTYLDEIPTSLNFEVSGFASNETTGQKSSIIATLSNKINSSSWLPFDSGDIITSNNINYVNTTGQFKTNVQLSDVSEISNYSINVVNATITVNKKVVSKPLEDATVFTYDGNPHTYLTYTSSYYKLSDSDNDPNVKTDAGTYDIVYQLSTNCIWNDGSEDNLTYKFVINKRSIVIEPASKSVTYTGQTQTIDDYEVIDGKIVSGQTVSYSYTYSASNPTDAGSYTVTIDNFDIKESEESVIENYDVVLRTGTLTINKATAEITVDTTPIVVTYGDSINIPTANSTFGTVTWDKTVFDLVDAGTYTITYTVAGTSNYDGDTKTVNVTINKKSIDKPSENTTEFIYSGMSQTYSLTTSDFYTISNNTRTDAGSQTVKVSLNDTTNYMWSDGTSDNATYDFVINPKRTVVYQIESVSITSTMYEYFNDNSLDYTKLFNITLISGEDNIKCGDIIELVLKSSTNTSSFESGGTYEFVIDTYNTNVTRSGSSTSDVTSEYEIYVYPGYLTIM